MATFSISPSVSGKSTWDLSVDGALTLSTAGTWTIVPSADMSIPTKIWGAGGGSVSGGAGAGGGYANGSITLASGTSYQLIVGGGGTGTSAGRTAAGGGAGSGIQFTSNSTAILVAGGGGGAAGGSTRQGGGGGGTSGSNGDSAGSGGGYGGTQSAAGAGGVGSRRTGNTGSGRNGGGGNTGSSATAGGTGFGNGGVGTYNSGDSGSGGGGGGYYGGGEGGGDAGGFGGGGGSGYLHPTLVASGTMTNGSNNLYAGNYTDSVAGTSGQGGDGSSSLNGNAGKIYFVANFPNGFYSPANTVVSGTTIDFTLYDSNSSNVSYTITGVTTADLNGTPLTGYFTNTAGTFTLSVPTKGKVAETKTLSITTGTYTANVIITPGISARYLIVAGGGGGGSDMGGGGGAGGYLAANTYSIAGGTYTVTVGAGGTGAPPGVSQVRGTNGQDSSVFGLTAIGGGGGASEYSNNSSPAGNGGSGGGVASSGSTTFGLGTAGQGNNGGSSGGSYYPGGGGGAGAAGSNTPGNGGVGLVNNILGTSYYWAAGGGGAGYSGNAGNGGLGSGGGGAPKVGGGGLAGTGGLNAGVDGEVGSLVSQTNKKGGAAGVNTGSGGGGGSHYNVTNDGGSGGSGIVVIRYSGSQRALGGTVTTTGTDTVHAFYSSGTFQTFTGGLTSSANTLYWGDSVTITYAADQVDGTNVAYTISGVESAQINSASLTGNFTLANGVSQITLQTTQTSVSANTISITAGGYTVNVAVSFLVSFTGPVGASWGANLTYTATTRGLSNNALIPYTITGSNVTSSQLTNFPLTGTFASIKTAYLGSNYFDGTGDYLTIPNGTAFQFGTGDFTIEFWIKTTDGSFDIINQYTSGGTNWAFIILSGNIYWQNSNAAASLYYLALSSLNANPTSGSWTHVALTRTSGVLKYWTNGVGHSVTQADSTNYAGNASEVRIGAGYYGEFQGNISNLRVVKGVAVYTSNFTPPTGPISATQSSGTGIAAITGTQTSLLTCKSQSSLVDLSTNAFTVTGNGNVAANTQYPGTFTSDGNSLNIGTGTLVITTNTTAPLLSSANGFVTVGGTTNSFTIRNPNPQFIGAELVSTINSISYVSTATSDVHSANTEALTSNIATVYSQFETTKYGTNPGSAVFINTSTSDVHTQNLEAKTTVVANTPNAIVETVRTGTTITTIIPTSTFAYSSGTEISANGNAIAATPTVTQTWYI